LQIITLICANTWTEFENIISESVSCLIMFETVNIVPLDNSTCV